MFSVRFTCHAVMSSVRSFSSLGRGHTGSWGVGRAGSNSCLIDRVGPPVLGLSSRQDAAGCSARRSLRGLVADKGRANGQAPSSWCQTFRFPTRPGSRWDWISLTWSSLWSTEIFGSLIWKQNQRGIGHRRTMPARCNGCTIWSIKSRPSLGTELGLLCLIKLSIASARSRRSASRQIGNSGAARAQVH